MQRYDGGAKEKKKESYANFLSSYSFDNKVVTMLRNLLAFFDDVFYGLFQLLVFRYSS